MDDPHAHDPLVQLIAWMGPRLVSAIFVAAAVVLLVMLYRHLRRSDSVMAAEEGQELHYALVEDGARIALFAKLAAADPPALDEREDEQLSRYAYLFEMLGDLLRRRVVQAVDLIWLAPEARALFKSAFARDRLCTRGGPDAALLAQTLARRVIGPNAPQ